MLEDLLYTGNISIYSILAFVMFACILPLNMKFLSNLNAHKVKEDLSERGVSFSLM